MFGLGVVETAAVLVIIVIIIVLYRSSSSQSKGQVVDYREIEFYQQEKQEAKEDKGSHCRTRDERNQGIHASGSDFKDSDRLQSGRSDSLREDRDSKSQMRRIPLGTPQSLRAAEQKLDEAKQVLDQVRRDAVWYRHPELVGSQVQRAEKEVEVCREVRNCILIESRVQKMRIRGQSKSGRQFKIGVAPPRVM